MKFRTLSTSAFSLVELIVVITIISILATISFIGYTDFVIDARDSTRRSDIGLLKAELRSHHQKIGAYPTPANYFTITNNGSGVAFQGKIDNTVTIRDVSSVPKDPKNGLNYGYSITSNRQAYQLATTLENRVSPRALVDGSFKTPARSVLPGLFLAITKPTTGLAEISASTSSGIANRPKFVLNNQRLNLLYNFTNENPVAGSSSFATTLSGAEVPSSNGYRSCEEIYEAWASVGSGTYEIVDITSSTGAIVNSGCTMNY